MLRNEINDALKSEMKGKNAIAVSTIRLIIAAIKDRDIAARSKGNEDGISDAEILQVLQTMVRQRHDSIALYKKGGRQDLADQEAHEIRVIESFLPRQLSADEMASAVDHVVAETGATSIKDMGKAMGALRARYAGQMDFGKASALLKERLSA